MAEAPTEPAAPTKSMQDILRDQYFGQLVSNAPPSRDIRGPRQLPSVAGREDLDLQAHDHDQAPTCKNPLGAPQGVIAERARKTNIVIINEDHSAPRHRWFVGETLKALRDEGYTIYAAEAFPQDVIDEGEAIATGGYYSNEPIFGRTIRVARQMGYELVAYEISTSQVDARPAELSPIEQVEYREQSQTDNLMGAIFRDRPDAKVVIHVGHSHVQEEPIGVNSKIAWMAARLKDATGRDPLTISQTACWSPDQSTVVTAERTTPGDQYDQQHVDLFVGYPRPQIENGRPRWRRQINDREVSVPDEFLGLNERVLIEARHVDHSNDSVPIDRVFLFPGERLPLLLPPGSYRIDGFVQSGKLNTPSVLLQVDQ